MSKPTVEKREYRAGPVCIMGAAGVALIWTKSNCEYWLQEVGLDEFMGDMNPSIWTVAVGNEKYELLPIIADI